MHLAYCSDAIEFQKDRLQDKAWSYRFPGSGWVTSLYEQSRQLKFNVASADVALKNVTSKKWSAKEVYVIQEMNSASGLRLLELGAKPFLITCLEAALYAPGFYRNVNSYSRNFHYSLGFGFSNDELVSVGGCRNVSFCFPSYFSEDFLDIGHWENKKKLVMVAGNKYKSAKAYFPYQWGLKTGLRQLKSLWLSFLYKQYRQSLNNCLHDSRLEFIEYFSRKKILTLYGAGWDDLGSLPRHSGIRLASGLQGQYEGPCQNKLDTIGKYQFAGCFENMIYTGYVTEKIIDCFVAGTIPLYLGAPDIEAWIPPESYIDLRKYSSYEELAALINEMSPSDGLKLVSAGRDYLATEAGATHSHESFARNVIRLAQTC